MAAVRRTVRRTVFNNLDFLVYAKTRDELDSLKQTYKSYCIIAYNEKHNLYYRGHLYKYADDLFELPKLYKYIKNLIRIGDINFDIRHKHMNFINWKIPYGSICGKRLYTDIEFFCKSKDLLEDVDDIIKRGAKGTIDCGVPAELKALESNLDSDLNSDSDSESSSKELDSDE